MNETGSGEAAGPFGGPGRSAIYRGAARRPALMKRTAVVLLAALLVSCAERGDDHRDLLATIDRGLGGGQLCAAPLRFPARPDRREPQYWFEEMMLREGVLRVVGPRASSPEPLLDVTPAFRFTTRKMRALPGYTIICYGSIHATRIIELHDAKNGDLTVRFHYESSLSPWGKPLAAYLRLQSGGDGQVLVAQGSAGQVVVQQPVAVINLRYVRYPPDGTNWYPPEKYPRGIPGALVPHVKV